MLAFMLTFLSGQYANNVQDPIMTTMGDDTGGETGHIPPTPPIKKPKP